MFRPYPRRLLWGFLERLPVLGLGAVDALKYLTYSMNYRGPPTRPEDAAGRELQVSVLHANNGARGPVTVVLSGTPPKGVWLVMRFDWHPATVLFVSIPYGQAWVLEHEVFPEHRAAVGVLCAGLAGLGHSYAERCAREYLGRDPMFMGLLKR